MAKLRLVDRRIATISVALTREERTKLVWMAKAEGHTMSDHVRMLVSADWDRVVQEREATAVAKAREAGE